MIKAKIKKDGRVKVKAGGKAADLAEETLTILHEVYQGIKAHNPEAATQYRIAVSVGILSQTSKVWDDK